MKKTAALITILFALPLVHGVQTQSILHSDYEDYIKGEFENVSLSNEGHLELAPALTEWVELDEPIIWAAVADAEGNLYLGTGNRGKVLKVDPEGEVTDYFSPEEILSRTLALDGEGNLYVGTSPVGRVYRITPGGRPEIYFDPEDSYIWDMTFDAEGNFYVATGSRARIYKLPPDFQSGDEADVWFKSDQTHLTSMTWDNEGRLLAGSSPGGILYRISEEGEGFALYNSGAQEIKQITVMEDGKIYFATFETKPGNGGSNGSKSSSSSSSRGEEEPFVVRANGGNNSNSKGKKREKKKGPVGSGIIFSIDESGFVEAYWGLPAANVFSFAQTSSGEMLVGTNDSGRIYSVVDRGTWKLLQQSPKGGEVSVLLPDPANEGDLLVITSNPARIYRIEAEQEDDGIFTSTPIDVGQIAQWGNLHAMIGGSGATFRTRSGNTDEPDETWAPWAEVVDSGKGNLYSTESPNARFLQYEITFAGKGEAEAEEDADEMKESSGSVRQVRLFFQTRNASPVIASIQVVPAGYELLKAVANIPNIDLKNFIEERQPQKFLQKPPARHQLKSMREEGLMTIAWKAYDPNGDSLEYGLGIKGVEAADWITLAEDLEEPVYSFNTRGFVDGYYQVKVTVSDHPGNDSEKARTGEKFSEMFLVDNSPPEIEIIESPDETGSDDGTETIRFKAADALSVLRAVYYTLDGQKALSLRPMDGLFDDLEETFTLELEELDAGPHSLILEAFDENGRATVLSLTIGGDD